MTVIDQLLDPRKLVVNDDPFDIAGKRGRWGRPVVTDPATGQDIEYGRPSTLAKKLDDQSGLIRWAAGMAALGVAENPSYVRELKALNDFDDPKTKRILYGIGERAKDDASPNRGADWGSLIHQTIAAIHRGEQPEIVDDIAGAVEAYQAKISELGLTPVPELVERAIVNDPYRLAGTFDIAYRTPDGRVVVGDVKTQKTADPLGWGVQLAIYTSCTALYDPASGQRSALPDGWDINVAYVAHVDYRNGNNTCTVYELDMAAFTGALMLALEVEDWRATAKNHCTPVLQPIQGTKPDLATRVQVIRGHDTDALVAAWTAAGLGKMSDLKPSEKVVAADVLDELEADLGIGAPSATDWRQRLNALPTDLAASARSELKLNTLTDNWLEQAPEAAKLLAHYEQEHQQRVETVRTHLTGLSVLDHAAATGSTPIVEMTRTQAERAVAMAHATCAGVVVGYDVQVDLDYLIAVTGAQRKQLLDWARTEAHRHGIKVPAKAADILASPALTALTVWRAYNQPTSTQQTIKQSKGTSL